MSKCILAELSYNFLAVVSDGSCNLTALSLFCDSVVFKLITSAKCKHLSVLTVQLDVVHNADQIYRKTQFGCFTNYGFAVMKVT